MVRLAGHDLMDFRNASGVLSGGSDGCLYLNDAVNAGLQSCVSSSNINSIYQSYCDQVSLADFIVIAAEALMARTATDYDSGNPFKTGTLVEKFKSNFRSGRTTQEECASSSGLMPDPEEGCTDLHTVFIQNVFEQCVEYETTHTTMPDG